MDQSERIVLEAEEGPVLQSVGKANKALQEFEKTGARASDSAGKSFERFGEVSVRAMDRSRASSERLVASIEKRAALAGKSGTDRLIAERDALISRLTGEEKAIERTRVAYARLIDAQNETTTSGKNLGQTLRDFAANPMQSAASAASGLLSKLATAPAIIAAFAVGIGAAVKESFDLVASLGAGAERLQNMSDRTGISVNELDKLQAMAKIAGIEIGTLEASARALSQGLSEAGGGGDRARDGLQSLGVQVYDVTGRQREMGLVMVDVLQKLGGVGNQARQTALATAVLGRDALELLPLIKNFRELEAEATRLGFGVDEYLLKRLGMAGDEIDKLGLRWDLVKRKLAVPAVAVVEFVVKGIENFKYMAAFIPGMQGFAPAPAGWTMTEGRQQIADPGELAQRKAQAAGFRAEQASTVEGMRARLAAIAKEQEPLAAALASGDLGAEAFAEKRGQFSDLEREQAGIEARIKALDDHKKLLEDKKREAEALAKVLARSRAEINHYLLGAAVGQEVVALDTSIGAAAQRSLEFDSRQYLAGVNSDSERMRGEVDAIKKQLEEAKKLDQFKAESLGRERELQEGLIKLRTGPGGEREAIEQTYALRVEYARRELELLGDQQRFRESMQEAEIDQVRAIAELEQQRFDRMRDSIESLFDAMLTRSRSLGSAIFGILQTAILAPIKQAFATSLAMALYGGRGGSAAGGGGGFGGGLGGALSLGGLLGGSAAPGLGGFGVPGAPGGTGGFAGPVQGIGGLESSVMGATGLGGGPIGLLRGLGNLGRGPDVVTLGGTRYGVSQAGVGGVAGGALLAGGGTLAMLGLQRGGWSGAAMTAAGGALIGAKFGGPIGAAIGGAIGFGAGLIRMLFKGAGEKVKEKIRAVYGIEIKERSILDQIVSIAKEGYGGNLDVAIRSQQVKDIVDLYSMTMSGKSLGLSSTPQGVSVYQSGGQIYQSPSVYTAPAASGSSQPAGGITVVMPVQVVGAREFLTEETHAVIAQSARPVQQAALAAQRGNYGRRQGASLQLASNLITA